MNEVQRRTKLVTSYNDLVKLCKNCDYAGAIKSCNRILHADPTDSFAFGIKITCHIQLGNFSEALEFFNKNPKFQTPENDYKRAYCLYRLNRVKEAEQVLLKMKKPSFEKNVLLTQIYYRMGKFLEAYTVYKNVYGNTYPEDKVEADCNMMAILSGLESIGLVQQQSVNVACTEYELKYNKACGLIVRGKFSEALSILEASEKLAVQTLEEEGYSVEEINNDTAIIVAQRGFVYQKLGREKDALNVYHQILRQKPSDETLLAVVSNNLLCVSKDKNVFVGRKRIKAMNLDSVLVKLNDSQKSGFALNKSLFLYHTQQIQPCKEACENLASAFPSMKAQAVKILSALAFKTGGVEAAKRVIDDYVQYERNAKTNMYLGLVQQLLRQEKKDEAIVMLKSLGKDSFCLGVVSALVTLYHSTGRGKDACDTLNEAVEHYRKSKNEERTVKLLSRQSVQLMMTDGNYEGAVKILEKLRKTSPNDPATVAQLVIAYSKYDTDKAEELSSLLPAIQKSELDVQALESCNWQMYLKVSKKSGKNSAPATPLEIVKSQTSVPGKRKRKKNKCPANYDPEKTPDPERWLPIYQRSSFKPQKVKRGKLEVGKGSQGSLTNTSENYDMSEKVHVRSKTPDENPATVSSVWKREGKKKKRRQR